MLFDALEECFKDTPPSPSYAKGEGDGTVKGNGDVEKEGHTQGVCDGNGHTSSHTPSPIPHTYRNMIDELYAGELIDYLRCMDVDYKSERVDKFLDFSLAIQTYVSSSPYSSPSPVPMHTLTECIEMFLRPELLGMCILYIILLLALKLNFYTPYTIHDKTNRQGEPVLRGEVRQEGRCNQRFEVWQTAIHHVCAAQEVCI
ncbi:hypothetical protein EON63_08310 [archaeon]|nr:MAG: hypothetical protein EON63_08310 [archaeon]